MEEFRWTFQSPTLAVEMLDYRRQLIAVCTRCREFASGIRTPFALLLTSTVFEKTR
jgi:hypothetical protein